MSTAVPPAPRALQRHGPIARGPREAASVNMVVRQADTRIFSLRVGSKRRAGAEREGAARREFEELIPVAAFRVDLDDGASRDVRDREAGEDEGKHQAQIDSTVTEQLRLTAAPILACEFLLTVVGL